MFEKQGKFYADWRDKSGRRIRKSFSSARAALTHEAAMKEQAHPKPQTQGKPLPHYSAPKTSGGKRDDLLQTKPLHASLSRRRVAHGPTPSRPRKLSKQSTCTRSKVIAIRPKR
jgi:hypothetical protein